MLPFFLPSVFLLSSDSTISDDDTFKTASDSESDTENKYPTNPIRFKKHKYQKPETQQHKYQKPETQQHEYQKPEYKDIN